MQTDTTTDSWQSSINVTRRWPVRYRVRFSCQGVIRQLSRHLQSSSNEKWVIPAEKGHLISSKHRHRKDIYSLNFDKRICETPAGYSRCQWLRISVATRWISKIWWGQNFGWNRDFRSVEDRNTAKAVHKIPTQHMLIDNSCCYSLVVKEAFGISCDPFPYAAKIREPTSPK